MWDHRLALQLCIMHHTRHSRDMRRHMPDTVRHLTARANGRIYKPVAGYPN